MGEIGKVLEIDWGSYATEVTPMRKGGRGTSLAVRVPNEIKNGTPGLA